jgi:hypothetical protein
MLSELSGHTRPGCNSSASRRRDLQAIRVASSNYPPLHKMV